MKRLAAVVAAFAWAAFAGALALAVVDGLLFSEGPRGFLPTAALFGFAGLGTVSAGLFALAARLAGRPWLRTPFGAAHAGVLALSYLSFTFLLLFR